MSELDEDAPLSNLNHQQNDDNDPSDEVQDFRFLQALTSDSKSKLPKRGEKDFEPHGTRHQDGILAASRKAMHDALDYSRVHVPKSHIRGFFYGEVSGYDETRPNLDGRKGLEGDHVVMVENSKGPHFRTMGKSTQGLKEARLWLLPEEALYLVERGNLDLLWPPAKEASESDSGSQAAFEEDLPISLQAAYSLLVGADGEKGKVSLEKLIVYSNLRRAGYVVARTSSNTAVPRPSAVSNDQNKSESIFTWIFQRCFSEGNSQRSPIGPLSQPGLYRSYNDIYRRLSIIPRHQPSPETSAAVSPPSPSEPFQLSYHVWKPSRIPTFAKSNPGPPDFHVAVVSARTTDVPTLDQMNSLLGSVPWDPPKSEWTGPEKSYQRLKHGWRNVVVAVVDQGIVSYLRMAEAAFGEERLYERFDKAPGRGGKKGGRGGGRDRGRGRGRGRR